jgi:hypothetical protein
MCITVILHLILLRHLNLQRTFLPLFYKSEPGQPQTNYATAWKITNVIIYDLGFKSVIKVNAYFAKHQRMIITFQEHVQIT